MCADAPYTLFVRTVSPFKRDGRHVSEHDSVDDAKAEWEKLRDSLSPDTQVTVAVILPDNEGLGSSLQVDLLTQAYN